MSGKIQMLKKLAKLEGNAKVQGDACRRLGEAYLVGDSVAQDMGKAVDWFQSASSLGDAKAQTFLVKLYRLGAEQEDAGAQYNLAICYEDGEGVAKDEKRAVELYRKAAEQGHAKAQCNLAMCYEHGTGVAKDLKKALELYRKAAEQEHAGAQFNLAACYEEGEGVVKDLNEARRLYQLAADQGDAAALASLGKMDAVNEDKDLILTIKNIRKAREALEKCTNPEAKCIAQEAYEAALKSSRLRCHNEGCSVAYQGDLTVVSQRLYPCSCGKVAYCGVKCQRQDWRARHKHACAMRGKFKKPARKVAGKEHEEQEEEEIVEGEGKGEETSNEGGVGIAACPGRASSPSIASEPSEGAQRNKNTKKKKKKKKNEVVEE